MNYNKILIKQDGAYVLPGAVVCSACNELIPEHEIYPGMLNMDADDVECIDCEIKYRDSADIDMFGG